MEDCRVVGPFQLRPDGNDDETALLVDPRCGFSQALPGHPGFARPTAEGPRHEARVVLEDVPVVVRYRLDPLPGGATPASLAVGLTMAYASTRAGHPRQITAADSDRLASWRVEGAASSTYPLKTAEPDGDHESVTFLVRAVGGATHAMMIAQQFAIARVDPFIWNLFSSAAFAALDWNPEAPASVVPRLWPPSRFLRPGLSGALFPEQLARVDALRRRMVFGPGEAEASRARLVALTCGSEPPAAPVDAAARRLYVNYLSDVIADEAAVGTVRELLDEVVHAHDLRGLARLLLRVLPSS